jgi:hypothetical protein
MSADSPELWPWLALAGLGAFHGLNPGMGWLFAVALGLHRQDRSIVYLSLLPIAAGHALSIGLVALAFVWAGLVIDTRLLRAGAGLLLVGWALYHWRYGHRHRVRIGMQAGMAGLALWSFLMATAHGAGLMLWPVLLPLCQAESFQAANSPILTALLGVGVHTLAMLAVTGAVASAVYEWVGLAVLRRAWLNADLIWIAALILAGMLLLLSAA